MRKLLLVFSCLLATVPAIQAEEHDRGERDNHSWNRGRNDDDNRDRGENRRYTRDRDDYRYTENRGYQGYPSYGLQGYAQGGYYRGNAEPDFRPNGYLPRGYVSQLRPYRAFNNDEFYVPRGARCGVYGNRVIVYDPISMLIFNVLSLNR